jgi:hypothetical protein
MTGKKIVVVGGGFSGCAAAIAASKVGLPAVILERTDMLSGAGLRAGIMNVNGKIVAAEEAKSLGGGEVFEALESIILHRGNIIDEEHAYVYNTALVDNTMRKIVKAAGVELYLESRVVQVETQDSSLKAVVTDEGKRFEGDVFVDASGTFGGMSGCIRYGHGCVMCIHRCPIFGDRVSIATKAGAKELTFMRPDGTPGKLSPSVTLYLESLSPKLRARLVEEGAFSIPIPEELVDYSRMEHFRGLRGPREVSHINLVYNGIGAKCVGMGYFSLENFRKLPGFENAQVEHPMGGAKFNFITNLSITPRENSLRARGFTNLFIAGDKTGIGGIPEVIGTGILAGNNAARAALGMEPVELPRSTAIGDIIALTGENIVTSEDMVVSYGMGHGPYFERMKELGLYSADPVVIHHLGLTGILARRPA